MTKGRKAVNGKKSGLMSAVESELNRSYQCVIGGEVFDMGVIDVGIMLDVNRMVTKAVKTNKKLFTGDAISDSEIDLVHAIFTKCYGEDMGRDAMKNLLLKQAGRASSVYLMCGEIGGWVKPQTAGEKELERELDFPE